jgi:hypothetical protein
MGASREMGTTQQDSLLHIGAAKRWRNPADGRKIGWYPLSRKCGSRPQTTRIYGRI